MLGGLKDKLCSGEIDKVINKFTPSISCASGGVTNAYQNLILVLKQPCSMIRDELIEGEKVKLVKDRQSKLPKVLVEGFKKSV